MAPPETLQFASADGSYKRQTSDFRSTVSNDSKHPPEPGRYHLYVSLACPWAHRALIVRALKGLEDVITVDVVHHRLTNQGWRFLADGEECEGATPDTVEGKKWLREIYELADPSYAKRWTVPVLWDKKLHTIVNNESSEVIRILNTSFNKYARDPALDLYPQPLRAEIDEINSWIYKDINNGVYKAGFATSQEVYEDQCSNVFKALDRVEVALEGKKYLVGNRLTEADVRLWTTIMRFDPVYITHFKCNLKTITYNYPNILYWARRIYQLPGVSATTNMSHIKNHYFGSHTSINPNRIVGLNSGPDLANPKVEA